MRLPQAKKQGISHPKTHTKFGDRKRATVKKQPPKRGLIQVVCYPTSPETVDITGFFEKFCIAIRTIKSKRYRCHWRKASGINRFRAFSARKFTDDSIDANHCFPLTGGIRTPFFRRLANSEPCGALFKAVIFKKGAIFLSIEYTKFEASICWSRRAIELVPFLFSDKFKKGTECQEVVNEPRTVFSGASHRSPP